MGFSWHFVCWHIDGIFFVSGYEWYMNGIEWDIDGMRMGH